MEQIFAFFIPFCSVSTNVFSLITGYHFNKKIITGVFKRIYSYYPFMIDPIKTKISFTNY
jgi:hypothetical protein